MKFENILFEITDGIARLTLNRPDKLNSFTGDMHAELRDALDAIQADKSVRDLRDPRHPGLYLRFWSNRERGIEVTLRLPFETSQTRGD